MIQTNKQTNSAQEKIFLNGVVTKRCYQSSLRCPRFAENVQEDSHGQAVTWAAMIVLTTSVSVYDVNQLQCTSKNGFYSEH